MGAISEVITRTASVISDYVNAAKIARENTEALSSSLTESQNKYAEDSKKIEESIDNMKLRHGWTKDPETNGKLSILETGSYDLNHMNNDEFGEYIEILRQKVEILTNEYEYSATVIRQCMTQVAISKDEFWSCLDDDGREKVSIFLSGITTDFLADNNLTTDESQRTFVEKLINSIVENKDGIADAFENLFTLNVDDMNVDDARASIQKFCTIIAKVLGKTLPEVQKILGYDDFFQTASNYDRTVAYASGGNYKSAKNVKDSKGFDQKKVLDAMDKYSINTDEEIDKFKEILVTAQSLDEAIKSYTNSSSEAATTTLTFSQAWQSIGASGDEEKDKAALEAKEELLELAKAGKLTEEAFRSSSIAEDFFNQTKLSAKEATQEISKFASSTSQLVSMKTGISSISSILGEKKEKLSSKKTRKKGIRSDTLAGTPEEVKAQTKEYERFVKVLKNGSSGMDKCKDAAKELAAAYITNGNLLTTLTDTKKNTAFPCWRKWALKMLQRLPRMH